MSDSSKRRIRDANSGRGTLIGEGFKFEGKISGRGNFMISGEVQGECDIEGTAMLAKNGHWRGTIKADSVIIAGTIEGDINASGRVEICDTARVSGTISSETIAVATGAVVEGVMQTTGRETPTKFNEKRLTEEE